MSTAKKITPTLVKDDLKPVAPVTAKRIASKALPKKPTAAPANPANRAAATKPAQAIVKPALTPKTTAKTAAKTTPKTTAKTATQTIVAKEIKADKVKKSKMVRDSFTIPKAEYLVLEALKERAVKLSRATKKSELLRAGIKALAAMSDAAFLSALTAVPAIKTGRPATAN